MRWPEGFTPIVDVPALSSEREPKNFGLLDAKVSSLRVMSC